MHQLTCCQWSRTNDPKNSKHAESDWPKLYSVDWHLVAPYACGYFYWTNLWRDRLLVLEPRKLEFSTVDNQSSFGWCPGRLTVVAGREETPETLSYSGCFGQSLLISIKEIMGEPSSELQSDDVAHLPCRYDYLILGAAEGFLLLRGIPKYRDSGVRLVADYFSLEVKTSKLVKVCGMAPYHRAHLYFGFPPSWTNPSIWTGNLIVIAFTCLFCLPANLGFLSCEMSSFFFVIIVHALFLHQCFVILLVHVHCWILIAGTIVVLLCSCMNGSAQHFTI